MHIEELISELVFNRINLNSYDSTLVYSFYDQISRGSGLTEKQSVLAVRILKRYCPALSSATQSNIEQYLENPKFRLPIRKVSNERRLSVADHTLFGRAIKAVFPYNEKTVETIRKNRDTIGQAAWDKDEKCWFFALNESSLQFLTALEQFEYDETIENYLEQIKSIHASIEKYVPMLIIDNLTPKLQNCDKNVPVLTSNDLISAIFEARNKGVYTWDETISKFIESDEVEPLTRSFLKSDPGEKFGVDSEIYKLSDVSTIVTHSFPMLVVIPGGNEFEGMRVTCDFFRELGVENSEMSVMFRLPSNTHEIFNNYVKLNELNSPITEKTKVVFVSGKIPKPIFKSGIKFNGVLNLGYANAHYTMRDFVKNHPNTLVYSKGKELKNISYGFL